MAIIEAGVKQHLPFGENHGNKKYLFIYPDREEIRLTITQEDITLVKEGKLRIFDENFGKLNVSD